MIPKCKGKSAEMQRKQAIRVVGGKDIERECGYRHSGRGEGEGGILRVDRITTSRLCCLDEGLTTYPRRSYEKKCVPSVRDKMLETKRERRKRDRLS